MEYVELISKCIFFYLIIIISLRVMGKREVGELSVLDIVIRDKGCGMEDVEKARAPMFTTGGPERSGMGFTIMEKSEAKRS